VSVKEAVFGTGEGVRARCPTDDWEFAPRFTDGACPLCGWKAEGVTYEPALVERVDWFMVAIVVLVLVSIIVGILVLRAYYQA
jgi:hypothetical protein